MSRRVQSRGDYEVAQEEAAVAAAVQEEPVLGLASPFGDGSDGIVWVQPRSARAAGLAPFYYRYPSADGPQPVYLLLNEKGDVTVDWDGERGGGVPPLVESGRTLRWRLPSEIAVHGVRQVVAGLWTLLSAVHRGHSVRWEGGDHLGVMAWKARDAFWQIECTIAYGVRAGRYDLDRVFPPEQWVGDLPAALLVEEGQTLEQAAAALLERAAADGVLLWGCDIVAVVRLLEDRPAGEIQGYHKAALAGYYSA